jgi:hypothetical protein
VSRAIYFVSYYCVCVCVCVCACVCVFVCVCVCYKHMVGLEDLLVECDEGSEIVELYEKEHINKRKRIHEREHINKRRRTFSLSATKVARWLNSSGFLSSSTLRSSSSSCNFDSAPAFLTTAALRASRSIICA